MLQGGELAPDFSVQTQKGNEVKLSDFEGKTIVIWFYPAADTGG